MAGNSSALFPCGFTYTFQTSVIYIVVSMLIICENVVGVLVLRRHRPLHATASMFVCSMAVTDIGAGVAFFLTSLFSLTQHFIASPSIHLPSVSVLMNMLIYRFVMVSVVHMAVIAVERYVHIAHPFAYRRLCTSNAITITLVIFWGICILYISENVITFITGTITDCTEDLAHLLGFYLNMFIYIVAATISGLSYTLLTRLATKHNRARDSKRISQREESLRSTLKTVQFFALVYGIFLALTAPLLCIFTVNHLFHNVPEVFFHLTPLFSVLVSSINFLVLSAIHRGFRSSLKKLLTEGCRETRAMKRVHSPCTNKLAWCRRG